MRKVIILLVILLLPLWAISYFIAGQGEANFDPGLQSALKEELGTKNFSKKAILSVESLDLSNYSLTSSKGLEQFTNLKQLNLSHNLLTDSTFLNDLPHLEKVDLSYNQFTDINFKSDKIVELNLRGNLLHSIDFTDNLQHLTYLNLRDNKIEDLSPVANNSNLTYLNVRGNKIRSLEPLASLNNLTDLNIRDNAIHSIQPIVTLPLTERLSLDGNEIDDLHLLEDKMLTINDVDFDIPIPKPKLSEKSGFYNDEFTLEIEMDEQQDGTYEVFYTLDGSIPNRQSKKYDGPIKISKDLVLDEPVISSHKTAPNIPAPSLEANDVKRAITIKAVTAIKKTYSEPREYSEPVTATYILDDHLNETHLPIVSLTVDKFDLFNEHHGIYVPGIWYEEDSQWSGNYAMRGREFERRATLELFNDEKELEVHQDVGIRIHGRGSRYLPLKSLRIIARDDYGQNSIYTNVFQSLDRDIFKSLILRQSGQDYNSTLLRDGLMHELVKDLQVDVQAYQPAIVLVNGEYWGIQNIRERLDEHYISNKYNVDKDDVILMKVFATDEDIDFEVSAGNPSAKLSYFDMLDYVEQNDMSNDDHLSYIETLMDIDNFFHFVAYQIYYANTDSFSNNVRVWRKDSEFVEHAPLGHDGRWRWMLFDLDWGMGFRIHDTLKYTDDIVTYNMIEHVLKDERRMSLFRHLMENDEARDRFITIMISLLNNEFEPNHVKAKIDELAQNIEGEMPHMIKRWNNIESMDEWKNNLQVLHDFAEKRPQIVKQHLMDKFNLTEEDLKEIESNIN